MNRAAMIDRVKMHTEPWDIVVIGGGAVGAGVAMDASARGLDVLLVEREDFEKGTSSRSTKLVHGGVRYLEQGNISLVLEALKERGLLLRNAPHLVHDPPFVVPNYSWWEAPFYGIGMKIYDLLAGKYVVKAAGSDATRTSALSRDHTIHIDAAGLLTIVGSKWTTNRHMAEDCVNHAITLGGLNDTPCVTEDLHVHGYLQHAKTLGRHGGVWIGCCGDPETGRGKAGAGGKAARRPALSARKSCVRHGMRCRVRWTMPSPEGRVR